MKNVNKFLVKIEKCSYFSEKILYNILILFLEKRDGKNEEL